MILLKNKIDKKKIAELPKVTFPGRIFVIYTEAEARKAVEYLNTRTIVGVDTETRPSFRKGSVNKVALLQVSTHDTCFLFRLNSLGLPDFLEDFLLNDVLKVGLSLKDDFAMLRRRNQKDLRVGNWIELQDYVPRFGIEEMSLQKIEAQQLYAATDAWACVRIYEYLEDLRASGNYVIEKVEDSVPAVGSEDLN